MELLMRVCVSDEGLGHASSAEKALWNDSPRAHNSICSYGGWAMMFHSSEPLHRLQINISKSCKSYNSVAEVSIIEVGIDEVGMTEINAAEIGAAKVGISEISTNEVGVVKSGSTKMARLRMAWLRSASLRLASLRSGKVSGCSILHLFQSVIPC